MGSSARICRSSLAVIVATDAALLLGASRKRGAFSGEEHELAGGEIVLLCAGRKRYQHDDEREKYEQPSHVRSQLVEAVRVQVLSETEPVSHERVTGFS